MASDVFRPARSVPLFGRSGLLEEASALLAPALQGQGVLLAIEGPAGVGKSTFLDAVLERARGEGFRVLTGRSVPSDLPPPYGLVRELLGSAHPPEAARLDRTPEGDLVPIFLAPLSERTPAREGTDQGSPGVDEAGQLLTRLSDPGDRLRGERRGLHDRLTDYFRELSEARPLLLGLDDFHLADRASTEFLTSFLNTVPRERIAVVVTLPPPGEISVETSGAIEGFLNAPITRTLRLPPLTELELAEYARWLRGGREPDPDLVRRWYSQTEGNPLFVENLVRAQTGLSSATKDLPQSDLRSLLERRIRELSEGERRVLVYGAVLGREFAFDTLERATGAPEEELTTALDRLVEAGILRERGNENFEFASERVRADVYGELTETRRGILHRKVLHALETPVRGASASIYDLARHAYLGRDDPRSAEYNRKAADRAAESFAFDAAAAYLERALEGLRRAQPRDLVAELRILVELGRVLDELGDLHRAEAVLEDAVARARAIPVGELDRAVALLGLARVRSDKVDLRAAETLAQEAFEILEKLNDPRGLMAAHRILGSTDYRLGKMAEAERHQRDELALAGTHGTSAERGHALIDLANTFISSGPDRLPEALKLYEEAAGIFADGHDDAARARVLMNRGLLYHNAGRMEESLADLERAAEAAERSRSKIWIGYSQLNLAQVLAEMHRPKEARKALDRSLALLEPQGDRLVVQSARMIRGIIEEEEGNLDRAEVHYREAVELARELNLGPDASESLYRGALLAERRGHREIAQQWIREAFDLGLLKIRGDLAATASAFARGIGVEVGPAHR